MSEVLKKGAPTLPQEKTLSVPELGGDVILRPLTLSQRFTLREWAAKNAEDENATYRHLVQLLSICVVDADHQPLFTADEWERWGGVHFEAVMLLWDEVYNLSGLNPEAAEKNSKAQKSS